MASDLHLVVTKLCPEVPQQRKQAHLRPVFANSIADDIMIDLDHCSTESHSKPTMQNVPADSFPLTDGTDGTKSVSKPLPLNSIGSKLSLMEHGYVSSSGCNGSNKFQNLPMHFPVAESAAPFTNQIAGKSSNGMQRMPSVRSVPNLSSLEECKGSGKINSSSDSSNSGRTGGWKKWQSFSLHFPGAGPAALGAAGATGPAAKKALTCNPSGSKNSSIVKSRPVFQSSPKYVAGDNNCGRISEEGDDSCNQDELHFPAEDAATVKEISPLSGGQSILQSLEIRTCQPLNENRGGGSGSSSILNQKSMSNGQKQSTVADHQNFTSSTNPTVLSTSFKSYEHERSSHDTGCEILSETAVEIQTVHSSNPAIFLNAMPASAVGINGSSVSCVENSDGPSQIDYLPEVTADTGAIEISSKLNSGPLLPGLHPK